MKSNKAISAYLNGPQKPPKLDKDYVEIVKKVMAVMN